MEPYDPLAALAPRRALQARRQQAALERVFDGFKHPEPKARKEPSLVYRPPTKKGSGGARIIHVALGITPPSRRGSRQKTASRTAYSEAASLTKHPDRDPIGRELRMARLRQAEQEFRSLPHYLGTDPEFRIKR